MSASIHACASNIARTIIGRGPTRPSIRRRRNERIFSNSLWLDRTRVYLGVQNILDPFRFVVEFQDSRAFNSIYQYQGQEINQSELISAYGELFFKDAFGKDDRGNDRPLTLRAGRFHFELLDRRLIAENEFRNTTNNFRRLPRQIGKRDNDWDLDSFLMRPVVRYPDWFDRPEWANWIYGSVLSIRRWSEYATIQPYFLGRKQFADVINASNALRRSIRETYAPGLRVYGVLGDFDYDFDINKQFGETGEFRTLGNRQNAVQTTIQHDAIAYAFEAGYTFSDHPWKPRISANYAYGSGNKSPFDSVNQTFDIFYGFNQPFSRDDYFAWNNIKAPKARLEFTPLKNLQIDTAFSAYWLASAAAAWDRANLFAPLGNRGTFIGTEVDFRARYKLSQFINLTASYARFWPGSFTSSFANAVALQPFFPQSFPGQTTTTNGLTARPTDFFYLEVRQRLRRRQSDHQESGFRLPCSGGARCAAPEAAELDGCLCRPERRRRLVQSDVEYSGFARGRRAGQSGGRFERDADRPDQSSRRLHRRPAIGRELETRR